jgi:hypothetical protein
MSRTRRTGSGTRDDDCDRATPHDHETHQQLDRFRLLRAAIND